MIIALKHKVKRKVFPSIKISMVSSSHCDQNQPCPCLSCMLQITIQMAEQRVNINKPSLHNFKDD